MIAIIWMHFFSLDERTEFLSVGHESSFVLVERCCTMLQTRICVGMFSDRESVTRISFTMLCQEIGEMRDYTRLGRPTLQALT
jgi:hypothetical protein